ncbi:MAG: c-type cytochrome [Deltaproteobacteria bacterium]|nr:c-type cytochrome [Deltaproteobacteria bacterium]
MNFKNMLKSRGGLIALGLLVLAAGVIFLASGGISPSRTFDPAALDPALVGNPEALREGQQIFEHLCAPCHGSLGEGKVGPSLRDAQWLYGNTFQAVAGVIAEGIQGKAMIAWKDTLSPIQISQVSAFVLSLSGLPGKP